MGLRKWIIERLGGKLEDRPLCETAKPLSGYMCDMKCRHACDTLLTPALTARCIEASGTKGNRSIKVKTERMVNGHSVILHGTLRINETRKKIKAEKKKDPPPPCQEGMSDG